MRKTLPHGPPSPRMRWIKHGNRIEYIKNVGSVTSCFRHFNNILYNRQKFLENWALFGRRRRRRPTSSKCQPAGPHRRFNDRGRPRPLWHLADGFASWNTKDRTASEIGRANRAQKGGIISRIIPSEMSTLMSTFRRPKPRKPRVNFDGTLRSAIAPNQSRIGSIRPRGSARTSSLHRAWFQYFSAFCYSGANKLAKLYIDTLTNDLNMIRPFKFCHNILHSTTNKKWVTFNYYDLYCWVHNIASTKTLSL